MIKLAVVCGPTASGKTRLAVDIAKLCGGEVVSADSMQIYKKLDIASAKPDEEEKQGIPHHLMDFLDPSEPFSVADYVPLAHKAIADIASRGKLPILCGGTGLYINCVADNIIFDDTGSDPAYRRELERLAEERGGDYLLSVLRDKDPETAARLHENNRKRIIRALEVLHLSGKTMSQVQRESRNGERLYELCMLMPDWEREVLYGRINARVDDMLERGLLDEAREFFTHDDYSTSAQAIGYKELKAYLDGERELSVCVEKLKQATRNYAKRQLTWFKKDSRINHIYASELTKYDKILKNAENLLKTYGFL